MGESSEVLRRKIEGAKDLGSVVRTMKALSAANISQYERSVLALNDYYHSVELGLIIYLKRYREQVSINKYFSSNTKTINVVVFGSDQGLVGQFNNLVSSYTVNTLSGLDVDKNIWAVGERVCDQLSEAGIKVNATFSVPNSVNAITPLIGSILKAIEEKSTISMLPPLYLFHNKPYVGDLYKPEHQYISLFEERWIDGLLEKKWATNNFPEVVGNEEKTLRSLIKEFLFVSLFRACAESQSSENASRMMAMQRAEKNIESLLENLNQDYHLLRQNSIDEELFDVVSGFEALKDELE